VGDIAREPIAEGAKSGLSWGAVRRTAVVLDVLIGRIAEFFGAALVLVETCILFAGVVSRYVFDSPIIWTDELATFLFCGWRCSARSLRCGATAICG
jgi:hypothetical protein